MKRFFPLLLISLTCLLPALLAAQEEGYQQTHEMSPLEQSFKHRHDQLSHQITALRTRIQRLQDLREQIEYVIAEVQDQPSRRSGYETDKYGQLEVLLPVAVRFSRDVQIEQTEMSRLMAAREELKRELLVWRGSLPRWWTEEGRD